MLFHYLIVNTLHNCDNKDNNDNNNIKNNNNNVTNIVVFVANFLRSDYSALFL